MLEELPNELLLEFLEYIDAAQLFRAFHGLNSRFESILFTHFHRYRLDFRYVCKNQPQLLSQKYFPSIINKIISIHLSDNHEERSLQADLLFSFGLDLNRFINLRSLSLCYINSEATMRKLMNSCHQLSHFTHLKVIQCHSRYMSSIDFSNLIWSLSRLTHCCLQIQNSANNFYIPTIVSLTLEYFSITSVSWGISDVRNLLSRTPHLQRLHAPLGKLNDNHHQTIPCISSVTTLKLTDVKASHAMINILRATPNLINLKVDAKYINCDGYRWAQIIDTYLLKIKIFQLRMLMEFPGKKNNKEHVDQLIDTFRNQFWLEKHQWFVRCHYISEESHMTVLLYTLPYAFNDFDLHQLGMRHKSTCPSFDKYLSYDRVNNFSYTSSINSVLILRFPHIRKLTIHRCVDEQFWKFVPTLHQLQSLIITSQFEHFKFQLQPLLNKIHSLHSDGSINENSYTLLRRLDLRLQANNRYDLFGDKQSWENFILSPLGMQCEELLIKVQNPEIILDLINRMYNLRILTIDFTFGSSQYYRYRKYSEEIEFFIKRLQTHLPSRCTIGKYSSTHLLWIYLDKS